MKRTKRLLSFFLAIVMFIATIPAFSIVSNAADAELEALITEYENMMASQTAYKNMSTAYDLYCQIQAIKDANEYGGKSYALSALKSDFRTAINNMKSNVWTAYKGTAKGYLGNTEATKGYANLLYSSQSVPYNGRDWYVNQKVQDDICYAPFSGSCNVMLYDGSTPTAYPIMFRIYNNHSRTDKALDALAINANSNKFALRSNWFGGDGKGIQTVPLWTLTDKTSALSYTTSNKVSITFTHKWTYWMKNAVYYNGGGDTSKYYEAFSGTNQAGFSSYRGNTLGTVTYAYGAAQYVINYAPVCTRIDYALSTLKNIGVSNFREGGLTNFFKAYDALTALNPNSYFTSKTGKDTEVEGYVTSCATDIKNAVVKMNTIINGNQWTTDSSGYYDELRSAISFAPATNDDCYASSAWNTYNNVRTTALNAISNPANNVIDNPGGSNYYTTSYSGTTIQTIAQNLVNATNTLKSTDKKHLTLKYSAESGNTANYVCASKDSHASDVKTGDIQNYNTLKMIYSTIDTGAYKDDAKTALNNAKANFDNVLNSSVTVDVSSQTLQDYIDSKTSALLNAINTDGQSGSPAVNQYTVTFNVLVDGATAHTNTINANYGTVVTLDASSYVNGGTCSSWDISIGGTTKTVAQPKNTYTILVQGNTTVTANCVSGNAVIIQDQYGNDLYVVPAAIGSTVSCSGNVVTVNSTAYTIPNMPYITINGYNANGKKVTSTVTTTESTTIIKPIASYSTDATYTITLDGAAVASDVVYDQDVTVSTGVAGAKGIAILNGDGTYSIASYSNNYEFYANRSMDFYTVTGSAGNYTINGTKVTDKLMIYSLDNSLPFIYSASATVAVSDTRKKMTTFSAYTTELPAGVTVIESGTLYSKAADLSATNFVIDSGRSDIFQKASATHIDFSNQFSLSFTTGDKVYTRGYVKYTYTYGGKQITAVAYSNICESN